MNTDEEGAKQAKLASKESDSPAIERSPSVTEEHGETEANREQSGIPPVRCTNDDKVSDNLEEHETIETQTSQQISSGPYTLISLIDDIPTVNSEIPGSEDAIATCIEAWEFNIYVGTSKGELLHFFKLDELGFMLISRQRVSSKTTHPVQKIVLMPGVFRALVLYNRAASCFMMPEMSPANIGRIKDVNDIAVDVTTIKVDDKGMNRTIETQQNGNGVSCILFTNKLIRFVLVTSETMQLIKDVDIARVKTGAISSNLAVVAIDLDYKSIELDQKKTSELFPVTSTPQSVLPPIIEAINENEFIMTCGTEANEPAMGMIIDKSGNVSRGTISWTQYPSQVVADYPNIIASYGEKLNVHSIQDQQLLQEMNFDYAVKIGSVCHKFSRKYDEIVEVARLVPLLTTEDSSDCKERVDEERAKASTFAKVTSSLLVYSARTGIQLLVSAPLLQRVLGAFKTKSHLEALYDDIQDEIKAIDLNSEYGRLQLCFSHILSALVLLKHHQFNRAFEYYLDNMIDPRIAIYIFETNLDYIYNDVWVSNGLKDVIRNLREIIQTTLRSESDDDEDTVVLKFAMDEFYKMLIKALYNNEEIERKPEIFTTIEVLHFLHEIEAVSDSNKISDLEKFIENFEMAHGSDKLVQDLTRRNELAILIAMQKHFRKNKEVVKLMKTLIKENDPQRIKHFGSLDGAYGFLVEFVISNYKEEDEIWEIALWLLDNNPMFGVKMLSSTRLKAEINELMIMRALNSRNLSDLSSTYLQTLVLEKNEAKFIGDLIFEQMTSLVDILREETESAAKLDQAVKLYQSLELPKLSFAKFLSMEFRSPENKKLCETHNRLFNFILLASNDTSTLGKDPNVLILAHARKILVPYESQLPYLMALISFKLQQHHECISYLCDLTDFKTAEFVAVKLYFPFNLPNYDAAIDTFIEQHRAESALSSSSQIGLSNMDEEDDDDDDEATLISKSTIAQQSQQQDAEDVDDDLTEQLLLQIFENYLTLSNFKLIESFLNTHNLFNVSSEPTDPEKATDKLEQMIERLPPNIPVAMISKFLSSALVSLKQREQNKILNKNLEKSITRRLKCMKKDLQE